MSADPALPASPNPYIRPGDGPWMRRYLNWAAGYYDKMPASRRADAAEFDRWLYSKKSLPTAFAVLLLVMGLWLLMLASGAKWWAALLLLLGIAIILLFTGMATWLGPDKPTDARRNSWRYSPWVQPAVALFVCLFTNLGFMFGRAKRYPDAVSAHQLWQWYVEGLQNNMPMLFAFVGLSMAIVIITQAVRRKRVEAQLARVELEQERDAQAALASKAELKVLQAQIQPHFIFNTLTALQHWTDTQDPRASDLLQSLTRFLRHSTDSMGKELVPISAELDLVRHYLHIMQQRLGASRLQFELVCSEAAAAQEIPPALLLSLVENAVEHGIEPKLRGGSVRVQAEERAGSVQIDVIDSGAALADSWHEGVGLSNCRARLAAHFGAQASLVLQHLETGTEGHQTLARVLLPLSDKPQSAMSR